MSRLQTKVIYGMIPQTGGQRVFGRAARVRQACAAVGAAGMAMGAVSNLGGVGLGVDGWIGRGARGHTEGAPCSLTNGGQNGQPRARVATVS